MDAALGTLLVWALVVAVLYWVVRLAVRHAIEDADRRRHGPQYYRPGAMPRRPAGRRPDRPASEPAD